MRRFRFRLERLERLRSAERRQSHLALARALADAIGQTRLREAAERSAERAEAAVPRAGDELESESLKAFYLWRERLRCELREAGARERDAWERAAAAEAAYVRASASHRVLERLRERSRRRWLERTAREEQKFLDEAHLLRLARRRGAEVEEVGR